MDALQESSANVESWKKQLSACKEESDTLREKVMQPRTKQKEKVTGEQNSLLFYKSNRRAALRLNEQIHSCRLNPYRRDLQFLSEQKTVHVIISCVSCSPLKIEAF